MPLPLAAESAPHSSVPMFRSCESVAVVRSLLPSPAARTSARKRRGLAAQPWPSRVPWWLLPCARPVCCRRRIRLTPAPRRRWLPRLVILVLMIFSLILFHCSAVTGWSSRHLHAPSAQPLPEPVRQQRPGTAGSAAAVAAPLALHRAARTPARAMSASSQDGAHSWSHETSGEADQPHTWPGI